MTYCHDRTLYISKERIPWLISQLYLRLTRFFASNDREGLMLNDRKTLGIPEGQFEID